MNKKEVKSYAIAWRQDNTGNTKVFYKARKNSEGFGIIKFFLKGYGFYNWETKDLHPYFRLLGQNPTRDGRKTVVSFQVHPAFFYGEEFWNDHSQPAFYTIEAAAEAILGGILYVL